MKRPQNAWLTSEIATLTKAFEHDPEVSARDLVVLIPRHTRSSIEAMWLKLGLQRLRGAKTRRSQRWQTIAKLLTPGPKSRAELAASLGCTKENVAEILRRMKGHWHIAGYRPSGHYASMTPVIGLGAGIDAPYPKRVRIRKAAEPMASAGLFSTAAGLVAPVAILSIGRRYTQSMDVDGWEPARDAA